MIAALLRREWIAADEVPAALRDLTAARAPLTTPRPTPPAPEPEDRPAPRGKVDSEDLVLESDGDPPVGAAWGPGVGPAEPAEAEPGRRELERAADLLLSDSGRRDDPRPGPAPGTELGAALDGLVGPERRVGRYTVVAELGRGGMGFVVRARDDVLRRDVAIKMILPQQGENPQQVRSRLERFRREARATARLRHPNIVSIHEVGEHRARPYLVMDYVDGPSLEKLLSEGRPPRRQMAEVVRQVALALDHAHGQGIIHRDVKPANVLLDRAGQVHLTDFGLARDLSAESSLSQSGMMVGTPHFLSPEQARADHANTGPHSDVFALGGLLYRAVTGRLPFPATTLAELVGKINAEQPPAPSAIDPEVEPGLEAVILRCLQKDPAQRYPSAAAAAEDLRRFLEEPPDASPPAVDASSSSPSSSAWRPSPLVLGGLGALAALLLALSGGALLWGGAQRRAAVAARAAEAGAARARAAAEVALRTAEANAAAAEARAALAAAARAAALEGLAAAEADRDRALAQARQSATLFARALVDEGLRLRAERRNGEAAALLARGLTLEEQPDARRALIDSLAAAPALGWVERGSRTACLAVAPSGALTLGGDDGAVLLVDLASGKVLDRWRPDERETLSPVTALAYSEQGEQLAWGTQSGRVFVADGEPTTGTRLLSTLPGPVRALAWSPDRTRLLVVASGGAGGEAGSAAGPGPGPGQGTGRGGSALLLLDAARGEVLHDLTAGRAPTCVTWAPQRDLVACGFADGRIELLDLSERGAEALAVLRPRFGVAAHREAVSCLAFTPDAQGLISAGLDGAVARWQLDGEQLWAFNGHAHPVTALAVGDGAEALTGYSADRAGGVRAWSLRAGEPLGEHEGERWVYDLALSASGWLLVVDSEGIEARDGATGRVEDGLVLARVHRAIATLTVAADEPRAVVWGDDAGGVWLRGPEGRTLQLGRHGAPVSCVATGPVGTPIATGDVRGRLRLWTPNPGADLQVTPGRIAGLAWSHDGRRLAVSGPGGTLQVLSRTDDGGLALDHAWTLPDVAAGAVVWRPDGQRLGVVSDDDRVWIVEPTSGAEPVVRSGTALAWSPDGRRLALAEPGDAIVFCEAVTLRAQVRLPGGVGRVAELAWSDDGERLAARGARRVAAFKVDDDEPRRTHLLTEHTDALTGITWVGADDLVTAAEDRTLRCWTLGAIPPQLWFTAVLPGDPKQMALAGGGTRLAVGSAKGDLWVYDLTADRAARLKPIEKQKAHVGALRELAVSADGRWLVSAGDDDALRLWSADGKAYGTVRDGETRALAFAPRGTELAVRVEGAVLLLDPTASERQVRRIPVPDLEGKPSSGLAWSPAGDRLAVGAHERVLLFAADGAPAGELALPPGWACSSLAFDPLRPRLLLDATHWGRVRLRREGSLGEVCEQVFAFELASGDRTLVARETGLVDHLSFDPRGQLLVTSGTDLVVRDAETHRERLRMRAPRFQTDLAYSADGRKLFVPWLPKVVAGFDLDVWGLTVPPAETVSAVWRRTGWLVEGLHPVQIEPGVERWVHDLLEAR